MPIYTRTGDKGKTSLFDGTRVLKSNTRVEAYGTVDELNSVIGTVLSQIPNPKSQIPKKSNGGHWDLVIGTLIAVQKDLFEIGAILANPKAKIADEFSQMLQSRVSEFEQFIDAMTVALPELTNFILPGGTAAGAQLQFARAVCRRAERTIIGLSQTEDISSDIIMYFNRLSDLLFTMSRYSNWMQGVQEEIWRTST